MSFNIKALIFSLFMSTAAMALVCPFGPVPEPAVPPAPFSHLQRDSSSSLKPPQARYPGVFVQDENGQPKPLSIKTLKVDVDVTGTMSRTTLDMTVYNPHNRVLEGEFSFPLNDGQTVARFALDINGKLRDAVVVTKSKGRETFEEVIRTKIDPALLEWTRDNSFKTRIYPIPAKGTRRVVIAYEQQLTSTDAGLAYTIPFAFPDPIEEFLFSCHVAGFGLRPSLTGGDGERIEFSPRGRSYEVKMDETDTRVDRPFTLTVPVALNDHLVTVNEFEGEDYVGAFLVIPPSTADRVQPRKVALLWDASLSGEGRDRNAETAVLDAFFKRVGSTELKVVTFANDVIAEKSTRVNNGDWSIARKMIESTPFDGGTQLGVVPFDQDADMIILVSDGISTFGKHAPSLGGTPVYVVSTGVPADHDILRSIAQQTGGEYLNAKDNDAGHIVDQMLGARRVINRIDVVDGRIDDIRPLGQIAVEHVTTITGKLRSGSAKLRISSSVAGNDQRYDEVEINAAEHREGGVSVARLWAQSELQRLNADRIRNEEEITALGQKFTIVTPGTSLLVLERIQDYVRFNIQPPANEPELVQQYKNMIATRELNVAEADAAHARMVRTMLAERTSFMTNRRNADSIYNAFLEHRASTKSARLDKQGRGVIDTFSDNLGVASVAEDEGLDDRTTDGSGRAMGAAVPAEPDNVPSAIALQPGVQASGNNFIARGSRTTETQLLVDGLSETDQFTGGLGAEYGNAVGGIVNTVVRDSTTLTAADGRTYEHAKQITIAKKKDQEQWTQQLVSAASAEIYRVYLELRPKYRSVTAFYLDVSDMLRDIGEKGLALRVLSNLAELRGEDHRDLRILGHRLLQLQLPALAVMVFEDVQRIRDEEPQSYRDLAIAYQDAGMPNEAAQQFQKIINKKWHDRFPEIELIAVMELSKLVEANKGRIDMAKIDTSLLVPVNCDVRVVLTWDADNCDMDLWVEDPTGEVCKYSNRDTRLGGHLSRDLTGGYGPEEFLLPSAARGEYKVKVHFYGNRQENLARPTTVQVNMFTNYGRQDEELKNVTLRLDGVARVVDVGKFEVN